MRHTRWLFLAAIVAIVVMVGVTYYQRRAILDHEVIVHPKPLENGVDGRANDWQHTVFKGDQKHFTIRARNIREIKEPSLMELEGVELQLFHENGEKSDLIRSEKAQFDTESKTLYSDGEVDIIMGVPADQPPTGRLLHIHGSGMRFASDTGKATTDRPVTFGFDRGTGSAVGAEYDPMTRELRLHNKVVLDWRGKTPQAKPMHVEAEQAVYTERDSKVVLFPASRFTRDTLYMQGGRSDVQLDKGAIRSAKVQMARGIHDDPGRKVEYAADELNLNFDDGMVIRTIDGHDHAQLISTSDTGRTTVDSDRLDMDFETSAKESTLKTAIATGKSVVQATPLTRPGTQAKDQTSDTRVLRSDVIRLAMKPGGKEIDRVETDGPGKLEFLPNQPDQPKRSMQGDRIWVAYGKENRIQSVRSINASTVTERPAKAPKTAATVTRTQSKDILATFDPNTSEMVRLEQTTNFQYEEGDRRARGDKATLDQSKDLMTLDGSARMLDPTGSVNADRIVMNQKSGDYTAEGHVSSTRQPDRKGASSAMLSNDEVMQAVADRMVSTGGNKHIRYDGNARAWQGANRVDADRIEIDRDRRVMEAHGKVVSQFADKSQDKNPDKPEKNPGKSSKSKGPAAPVFTVVRATDLVYTEETRVAVYQGGVVLTRPSLTVNSKELQAFLKPADSDSSLDKAFADGAVKIVSIETATKPARTRTGTSEHAEYYADEQKVLLQKGEPLLVDNVKGNANGRQITWWANNDRLVVDGEPNKPAEGTIRKK
ncbi:MAG TPA: LPS export ABC transporter periplasmic protein LptC [Bryobacteraceae bacterium]|jgi:lipopolysaccharide export system protein LptA|nr:LPS export ABC transporter periplasmic protein LptC [Bryobacteraceae bacterium]